MRIAAGSRSTSDGAAQLAMAAVVFAAVMFNAGLAVVNAHVKALTPLAVVGCELLIVMAAHALAFARYRPQMTAWYALIGVFALIAAYRSLVLQSIDPKFFRDVLLVPTFVILGLAFERRLLTALVVLIHAVVLAGLVLEALDTPLYSALFKIQDYYINTRGYDVQSFWNKDSELYVSAVRPDARMFSFIDLHRLSSIFLEPVSLGNYCIVITAFVCARFGQLGWLARWFLMIGNAVAIIGCDGRLAAVASLLIIAASLIAPRLPRHSAAIYLPLVVVFAFVVVNAAGFQAGPDNFSGRLAHGVALLSRYDAAEFAGISNDYLFFAVDSGLAYLITTQSLLGVAMLWFAVTLGSPETDIAQVRYVHAVAIFLSLTMLVSFGFLTIKIAALMWFIYGSLNASGETASMPAPRSAVRSRAVPLSRIARAGGAMTNPAHIRGEAGASGA